MAIQVQTQPCTSADVDWLVVAVPEAMESLTGPLQELDGGLGGQITRLRESQDLTGKLAETLAVPDAPGVAAKRILFTGLGKTPDLLPARLNKAMMAAAREVSKKRDQRVAVVLADEIADAVGAQSCGETVAVAFTTGPVGQDLYRREPEHFPLQSAVVLKPSGYDESVFRDAVNAGCVLGDAVNLTRELVNRPAGEIYPESFAQRAEQVAGELGLRCEILDENRIREERMQAVLAVSAGSDRPPRVVRLEHRGAGDDADTLAFVGKGVTFDSGGLSLKSNDGMLTMKSDMAGAATVLGAVSAIKRLELPVNVVGYAGLVENMINGSSYKLGDVVTVRNGVTVEIHNTDAEGRMVLADVLSYAVDRGADRLVDLATLTGACVVALGEEITGIFSNDQPWCDRMLAAANGCGEHAWQLPVFDDYAELLKSDVADVKNVGGRWGGAILAAMFLEKFVGETPWVHLDIAGPSFGSSNQPHREGGATGCMVRSLVEIARGLQTD